MATHDEITELLGAYALDAVDPGERDEVERHLVECPRCAAEVADHREVAAMLAHTGGAAPEGVWSRIVDSLEETPPAFRPPSAFEAEPPSSSATTVPIDELAQRRRRRLPLLGGAAAAVALVIGLFAGLVIADDDSSPGPETVALPSLDAVARQALSDPDARKTTLSSLGDEELTATAAVDEDGSGYLVGTSLPALEPDETYQLWGINGTSVVSLGVLGHSPDVVAFHMAPDTETLAITKEVAPGVVSSENEALVIGSFS